MFLALPLLRRRGDILDDEHTVLAKSDTRTGPAAVSTAIELPVEGGSFCVLCLRFCLSFAAGRSVFAMSPAHLIALSLGLQLELPSRACIFR